MSSCAHVFVSKRIWWHFENRKRKYYFDNLFCLVCHMEVEESGCEFHFLVYVNGDKQQSFRLINEFCKYARQFQQDKWTSGAFNDRRHITLSFCFVLLCSLFICLFCVSQLLVSNQRFGESYFFIADTIRCIWYTGATIKSNNCKLTYPFIHSFIYFVLFQTTMSPLLPPLKRNFIPNDRNQRE